MPEMYSGQRQCPMCGTDDCVRFLGYRKKQAALMLQLIRLCSVEHMMDQYDEQGRFMSPISAYSKR